MGKIETFPTTSLGAAAAAVVEGLEPKREPIKPGIYFGLDSADYHADEALGSSDLRRLAVSPEAFWFESRFNPLREDEEVTEAKLIGTAMHLAVLEGRNVLERQFAPYKSKGNTKAGKDEIAAIVAAGKTPLKWKAWERILQASAIVRGNAYLGDAFANPIGTEVSVFWTDDDGIPKKCRFDALKMRAIVDLKSIENRDDVEFVSLCRRHLARYGYHVQAAHYLDGWSQMAALIAAGAVYGLPAGPEGADTLARLTKAASQPAGCFVFVFVQKKGAPLTWGTQISAGNPILDEARRTLGMATDNWKVFSERHGLNEPWVFQQPLLELASEELPAWCFR